MLSCKNHVNVDYVFDAVKSVHETHINSKQLWLIGILTRFANQLACFV